MSQQKIVLMSELSDIRYDARVLKEAETLVRNGYFVTLVMYNSDILRIQNRINKNLCTIEIPFSKRYDTKSFVKRIYRLVILIKVIFTYFRKIIYVNADYYHAHNFYIGWMVYLSSIVHKGIFIYDQHELILDQTDLKYKIALVLERFLVSKAQLVICPSQDRGKVISKFYDLNKPLIIINNFPSSPKYKTCINENIIKKELGLDEKVKILFYSGMLSIETRLQVNVIRALSLLPPEVVFVIIGFGHPHEIKKLQLTAENYMVSNQLFILPPKSHSILLEYTQCGDIGISLLKKNRIDCRFHALNKFYEYVASGMAVLSSDFLTFNKEIYHNPVGRIGSTCNEENSENIAEKILELISDDSLLDQCKRNSKEVYEKFWNWEKQENNLIDAYNKLH